MEENRRDWHFSLVLLYAMNDLSQNQSTDIILSFCSEATKGSLDDDCDIETIDEECLEYGAKLDELEKLLEASKATMASIESKAQEVKAIKIPVPQKKTVSADSPKLKAAVADAKKVTEEKGIQSPEAALAWETVEEIASADNSGAMGGRLTDECLVDATDDACKALEELNRVLKREA